jgi:hypothetical protein
MSNRDPLTEFAEHFVAALMGGQLAVNPIQAYWDIELADGGEGAGEVPGQHRRS